VSHKPYALSAIESLRGAQRSEAEQALARARDALERAEIDLAQAKQAHTALLNAATQASPSVPGTSSGLELQRIATHAARLAASARADRDRVAKAQARVDEQATALQDAQSAVAHALAGEQVIERDRARWQSKERRERERKAELELEEARPGSQRKNPAER
jgi:hypothetical protein